jgi:predicted PurR-regulated permease PerM
MSVPNEYHAGLWLLAAIAIGWVLYLLAPVLTPFVVAALLAYLGDPVADWLQEKQFSRTLAVVSVFVAIIIVLTLLLVFLVPLLSHQFAALIQRVPAYLEWLQTHVVPWARDALGLNAGALDLTALKDELAPHLSTLGGVAAGLFASLSKSSIAVIGWIANLLLVPVVAFYLLRDWDVLKARIRDLLPRTVESVVTTLAEESDEVLGAFLRGQFMVMAALGVIYSAGLAIVGLDFALLIGMLSGMVSFVPYLGFIVGIVVAGIAALLQFQEFLYLLPVVIVFAIAQAIEGMLLTPLLVGDRIGLHPVAVIFAVLAGGHLFGFFGILLALPVAAVVMVLLRHTRDEYLRSALYGNHGD